MSTNWGAAWVGGESSPRILKPTIPSSQLSTPDTLVLLSGIPTFIHVYKCSCCYHTFVLSGFIEKLLPYGALISELDAPIPPFFSSLKHTHTHTHTHTHKP